MNATKFVVLLVIGVVCANVGARQLEGVPKDANKLGVSVPKAATTNGIGAELDSYSSTSEYSSNYANGIAAKGPGGSSATGTGCGYQSTGGYSSATGPVTTTTSSSGGSGNAQGAAAAGPGGAAGRGSANGGGSSYSTGSSGPSA